MRKIGIYLRVSTKYQAELKEGSIKSQKYRLEKEVENRNRHNPGWGTIVEYYIDEAKSGKNMNRPAFQKMIFDVRKKKVDTIMVTELSRLSRSVQDFLHFIEKLSEFQADFICPQYNFYTTSPIGRVFITIIMALAQFERELTGERVRNNFHARALRGLINGGRPPLGFDRDPQDKGKFILNQTEIEQFLDMCSIFEATGSLALACEKINEKGYRTKRIVTSKGNVDGGRPFTVSSLYRTLTNVAYIGKRELNQKNKEKDQSKLKEEERYKVIDAAWKPIISKERFEKIEKTLKDNFQKRKPETFAHREYLLTGMLKCGECKQTLNGAAGHGRSNIYRYYIHRKKTACTIPHINADSIEKRTYLDLKNFSRDRKYIEEFFNRADDTHQKMLEEMAYEVNVKEQRIRVVEQEMKNLIQFVSKNPAMEEIESIQDTIKKTQAELNKLKEEKEVIKIQRFNFTKDEINIDDFQAYLDQELRKFYDLSTHERKTLLRGLLASIYVCPDNDLKFRLYINSGYEPSGRSTHWEKAVPGSDTLANGRGERI